MTLRLDPVSVDDQDAIHALNSDPALWNHFPSGRSSNPERTRASLARYVADWAAVGLGYWTAREPDGTVVGIGGVRLTDDGVWNVYYRVAASRHGRGYATRLASAGLAAAHGTRPDVPVTAFLLEHNVGSRATADKVGLALRWTGPDAGNPDPSAVRLVYADRDLDAATLARLVGRPG